MNIKTPPKITARESLILQGRALIKKGLKLIIKAAALKEPNEPPHIYKPQ